LFFKMEVKKCKEKVGHPSQ
jgi:hypothetical protein